MAKRSNAEREPDNFEAAMDELESLLAEMDDERVPLEQTVERYERGTFLLKWCRAKLSAAEQRIRMLTGDESGELTEAEENQADE